MNIDKKLDEILNMITPYWDELSDGDRVVKSVIGVGGKDEVKQEIKQLFQELIDEEVRLARIDEIRTHLTNLPDVDSTEVWLKTRLMLLEKM